jgi:histidine kinase
MAAGIAHELNQPLVGVRGLAEHTVIGMERGWKCTEAELKERLTTIIEQADRMSHIIEHVRMFAREAGKPELQQVQVNDVVEAAADMLGAQFRSRGIELECDLAENLPPVLANPFSLEEVVLNLIINARDAVEERLKINSSDAPLRVLLRTFLEQESKAGQVKIEVVDWGVGIPEDILPNVFDPFFTTKEPNQGTGLGLSISQSIIEQFEGKVDIQSTLGQGTTVTISLPTKYP